MAGVVCQPKQKAAKSLKGQLNIKLPAINWLWRRSTIKTTGKLNHQAEPLFSVVQLPHRAELRNKLNTTELLIIVSLQRFRTKTEGKRFGSNVLFIHGYYFVSHCLP